MDEDSSAPMDEALSDDEEGRGLLKRKADTLIGSHNGEEGEDEKVHKQEVARDEEDEEAESGKIEVPNGKGTMEVSGSPDSDDDEPLSGLTAKGNTKRRRKGVKTAKKVTVPEKIEQKTGPDTPGSSRSYSSLELPEEELNLLNEDECAICGETGELVCCDGPCLQSFHYHCQGLDPLALPEGKWFCSPECARGEVPPLHVLMKGRDNHNLTPENAEKLRHRKLRMLIHRDVALKWQGEGEAEAGQMETLAALRGIDYLYRLALNKKNFGLFGSDILAVLYDLSSCTEGAIRQAALQRTEVLARHWKSRFKSLADIARDVRKHRDDGEEDEDEDEEPEPSKDDVNTAIRGVYVLMRMGLWTPLAAETREFVKSGRFKVQDFLDFDPRKKPNPLPRKRPQFSLANAIDTAFHADRVGVRLGASVLDVISLLPKLRPYEKCVDIMWEDWEDQADMVINLIHVCSNNGELRLEPAVFPDEHAFFRDPETLKWPMEEEDVHLVGEICHCLKVLGATGDDPIVQQGKHFILQRQEEDGSWPVRDKTTEPWDKFLATVSGVVGLVPLCARAYGPGDTALADTLRKVNTATSSTPQAIAKAVEEAAKPKVAPPSVIMCGNTRPLPVRRFRSLQTTYERSSDAHIEQQQLPKGESAFLIGDVPLEVLTDASLKGRSQQRFQELLSYKKRKMAPPPKGSLGVNWFRHQEKNKLASAVRRAAEALKDFQNGREPDLRPVCGTTRTDLYSLYQAVAAKGGRAMVPTMDDWAAIARKPQVNAAQGLNDRGRRVKELYERYLGDFELAQAEDYHAQLQREEVGRIIDARMQERADKQRLARQAALPSHAKSGEEDGDEDDDDEEEDREAGGAARGLHGGVSDVKEPLPLPSASGGGEGLEGMVIGEGDASGSGLLSGSTSVGEESD